MPNLIKKHKDCRSLVNKFKTYLDRFGRLRDHVVYPAFQAKNGRDLPDNEREQLIARLDFLITTAEEIRAKCYELKISDTTVKLAALIELINQRSYLSSAIIKQHLSSTKQTYLEIDRLFNDLNSDHNAYNKLQRLQKELQVYVDTMIPTPEETLKKLLGKEIVQNIIAVFKKNGNNQLKRNNIAKVAGYDAESGHFKDIIKSMVEIGILIQKRPFCKLSYEYYIDQEKS